MKAEPARRIIGLLKSWFGDFEKQELLKFLKLGVIFGFVIGVYWTMRPLKDSIFASMVHAQNQPLAKLLSLIVLFPMVMLYSVLIDTFTTAKHRIFYVLGALYAFGTLIFAYLFMHPTIGLANTTVDATRIVAWTWYVFVESYGSLLVALFWAFAADMVNPESAKRGFPLVIMIGQIGSILGPLLLTPLGKNYFGNSGPTVAICGGLIIVLMVLVFLFVRTTPKSQLHGYHGRVTPQAEVGHNKDAGFFEGLTLLVRQKYLLGIFGIIAFYEIITQIIDFNFKVLVYNSFASEALRTEYLGSNAVLLNLVAFLSLLFGVSNIQRRFGIKTSLVLMPLIVAGMVASFWAYPVVHTVFWIVVVGKAMNYALNGPALKQLYVPTTKEVKYKSQTWIETFGSRGSKSAAAGFNLLQKPFTTWWGLAGVSYLITIGTVMSFGLIGLWFVVARFLGKKYEHAVAHNEVVC